MIRKFEEKDVTTESVYKSCKHILYLARDRRGTLKGAIQKHLDDYELFCDQYESGIRKPWHTFFKRGYVGYEKNAVKEEVRTPTGD